MRRRILDIVVIPILFVLASILATSTLILKENAKGIKRNMAIAAAKAKAEAEAKAKAEAEARRLKAEAERLRAERIRAQIVISSHDKIFKEVAKSYKLDWLLLAAIAQAESKFQHSAVSPAGATGLMQIMPIVAENFGYSKEQLRDVRTNVELAAMTLNENKKLLRMPEWLNEKEKLKFTLACYNAGYGRIADAIALTRHFESNAYKWSDVATFLSKLADPTYAKHKVVRHGRFKGSKETIAYVDKVINSYDKYQEGITDVE